MNRRELMTYMEENGFQLHRESGSHYIFRDALTSLVVAKTMSDWRGIKNNEARVKQAVRKREEMEKLKMQTQPIQEPQRKVIVTPGKPPVLSAKLGELAQFKNPEPATKAWNDPTIRYDKEYKDKMGLRVLDMHEKGYPYHKIAAVLNSEGFKNAHGNPITTFLAQQMGLSLGLRRRITVEKAQKEETEKSPETVAKVPKVTAQVWEEYVSARERAVGKALADHAKPKAAPEAKSVLPKFAMEILKDSEMSDYKKVRMLIAFASCED